MNLQSINSEYNLMYAIHRFNATFDIIKLYNSISVKSLHTISYLLYSYFPDVLNYPKGMLTLFGHIYILADLIRQYAPYSLSNMSVSIETAHMYKSDKYSRTSSTRVFN